MVRDYYREYCIYFYAIYSGPLLWAVQTAQIIIGSGSDTEIQRDDLILEMEYGSYEGCNMENPALEILHFFRDFVHNPAPKGMESLEHVTARMGKFIEKIKGLRAENVLVTTHAIAMKGALEYLTPESHGSFRSKYIGTCTVYMTDEWGIPKEMFSINHKPGV